MPTLMRICCLMAQYFRSHPKTSVAGSRGPRYGNGEMQWREPFFWVGDPAACIKFQLFGWSFKGMEFHDLDRINQLIGFASLTSWHGCAQVCPPYTCMHVYECMHFPINHRVCFVCFDLAVFSPFCFGWGDASLINFGSDNESPVPKRHCKGATRPAGVIQVAKAYPVLGVLIEGEWKFAFWRFSNTASVILLNKPQPKK